MCPPPQALASPPPTASVRRLRPALGTLVAIEAHAASVALAHGGVESAFAAIGRVDARLNPERAGSDLRRMSAAAPGRRVAIAQSTRRLLALACRLHEITGGAFDPCLPERPGRLTDLELSTLVDDPRPLDEPASRDEAADLHNSPAWVVCRLPVAVDFGGFAKGYAVDCAVEALLAAGCTAGMVNAGGDLRTFGGRRETVLLRRCAGRRCAGHRCAGHRCAGHRCAGHYVPFAIADGALAVSDAQESRWPPGHRGYYRRGRATAARSSYAAVLAPTAAAADALTKCVLLCTPPVARRALREFRARRLA